ncbi:hypothetical protein OROGR_001125 [Orobanche gracilis]
MNSVKESVTFLFSNSLFSTIITLYTLLLLYFPYSFLQFIFSPVVFSTLIVLLYLLRLGASQKPRLENDGSDPTGFNSTQSLDSPISGYTKDPNPNCGPFYAGSFVEWDVRAPLEVIYEEYEGEEAEENDAVCNSRRESEMNIIHRYASLSLFYPESDSDDSSEGDSPTERDWDSPEDMCFRWEEEDHRNGLIEIALDEERRNCEVDEENLIVIDLSPAIYIHKTYTPASCRVWIHI